MIAGVCALTFFTGLGCPAVTDSDEAFYAEAAREMIDRGDWLTPYYNGEVRFEKPVLYYWLAAGAYALAGVSPGASRLPSALAGLGLALLAYACARRWYDEATGLLAGLVTATSFGYVAMAHQALPDLPLAFFVTLATWGTLVGLRLEPDRAGAHPAAGGWLIAAAAAAAAAFLVKGPVGLALPAAVLVPVAAWTWRREGRPPSAGARALGAAAVVFLLLAVPWYAAMAVEHGPSYVERFFVGENFDRFATARYNDPRPVWYYLPIVAAGLLPWTPFTVLWGPPLRRAWRERRAGAAELRLALWALAPLVFYTISVGKQPRYVLPVLPPLAVLLAAALRRAPAAETRRLLAGAAVAAGALTVFFAERLYAARPLLVEWSAPPVTGLAAAVLLLGAAVAVAGLMAARRDRRPPARRGALVPALVGAASAVLAVGAFTVVLASPGPAPVERMAALVGAARGAGEPYCRYRVFTRNLVYYAGPPAVAAHSLDGVRDFLRGPDRVLCVLLEADVERLETDGLALERLGRVSYLDTGSLTLRALVDPDPERYLQQVVLVANRPPPRESAP